MQRVSKAPLAGGALWGKSPLEGVRGTRRVERRGRLSPNGLRAETEIYFQVRVRNPIFFDSCRYRANFKNGVRRQPVAAGQQNFIFGAVSRKVRFSTLFKVQGQMKVSGQGSSRDRFPQIFFQWGVPERPKITSYLSRGVNFFEQSCPILPLPNPCI